MSSTQKRLLPRRRTRASASCSTLPKTNSLMLGTKFSTSAPELRPESRFYFKGIPLQIVDEISNTAHSIVFKVRSPSSVSPRSSINFETDKATSYGESINIDTDPDTDTETESLDSSDSYEMHPPSEPHQNQLRVTEIIINEDMKESPRAILKVCTDDGSWQSERDFNAEEDTLLKIPPHPNIVQCYGIVTDNPDIPANNIYLNPRVKVGFLMEYCPHGNLREFLIKKPIQKPQVIYIIKEMLKPIAHLHSLNIIHRDIRSLNYLISSDGKVKLCDFGLCRKNTDYNKGMTFRKFRTNPVWTAPEIYDFDFESDELETPDKPERQYTFGSDIYSLTIVIWEVVRAWYDQEYSLPMTGSIYQVMRSSLSGKRPNVDGISPEWIKIMSKGWNQTVSERPTITELSKMIDEIDKD